MRIVVEAIVLQEDLSVLVAELKRDQALESIRRRVEKGDEPRKILDECRRGMEIVGERYENGGYFLAELMLAGEIFREATAILEPYLAKESMLRFSGKVVLATLSGDIHDLGKNILAVLLRAQGFEVHDIGVDVDPRRAIKEIRDVCPRFVGFSALMTPAFGSMKEAAGLIKNEGLRNGMRLMIGGGATNAMVKEFVGADFQTTDAIEGVRYCLKEA